MVIYIYKNFQARAGDNAVWSAIRIFTVCTAFTGDGRRHHVIIIIEFLVRLLH